MASTEPGRDAPQPAMALPPRPRRALSSWQLLRTFPVNSVAACDEELFEELFVERRYWWGRVCVVSDPDGIRHVMHTNTDNYERAEPMRRAFTFSSGGSMNHVEGETWWRHRRTINPTLDHRALQPDFTTLVSVAEEMTDRLLELPPGEEIEIGRALTHLITRWNGYVFAGDDRRIDALLLRLGRFPENYGPLDVLLPRRLYFLDIYRRQRAGLDEYYALIDEMMAERRRPGYDGSKDLLWRMATARDRVSGLELSAGELRDEVMTLAAGAQAPLRTLTWAVYLLNLFRDAERQLVDEIDAVLGTAAPTPDLLAQMSYRRRLVDEVNRLYPPLPVTLRQAVAPDTVCGRPIPRGTYVAVMPWVVHRHRRLWTAPERFDPERFAPEQTAARPRYAYIPFGVGPHVCVGASLSMIEIEIAMAVLFRRLRFRLVPGRPIEPTAWSTLRPRDGIWVTVEPR